MINPIEHARTKEAASKYKVEPYVIPADIYGGVNLAGRGGWTWYTGSSSWYYEAGIEYLLGIKIRKGVLSIEPCIPSNWKEYETDIKLVNPICKKAKMADLPEDCGGPWGYEELLDILANKNHERYKEMKDWVENGFFTWHDDREYVDIEEINMRLKDYKEHAKFLLGDSY